MNRKYLGFAVLLLLFSSSASAGPFVDSLIIASKTFTGSIGVIEVAISNDSAMNGWVMSFLISSTTGGAFGKVDSVQALPSLNPLGITLNLTKVNGVSPDSMWIQAVDPSGGSAPPGARRDALKIFMTNNRNPGTYTLDTSRLFNKPTLRFTHPPTQISVPRFISGVETIFNDPPVLSCVPYRGVYFGAAVSILPEQASDPESDPLTFSLVSFSKTGGGGPPLNAPTVDASTGRFSWPTAADVAELGTWEATIAVTDLPIRPPLTCTVPIEVTDLRGDVNNDGLWSDLVDVIELINKVVFQIPITSENPNAADVNCNGVVDLEDIVALVNFVVFGAPAPCRG